LRTVALADGGSVVLSGGTSLELDRDNSRFARLESGQALFTIRHDERNPFAVEVGDDRLVDAGTVFDVEMSEGGMQVAVSEGLVLFNPGKQNVRVAPGHILAKKGRDHALTVVAPEQVGEWRSGRLTFEDAPLSVVAARLSRMTGIDFAAEGAGGSFSGSLSIAPLREDPASLGALLGANVRHEGGRWIIAAN
jgi:transmembrane sensor